MKGKIYKGYKSYDFIIYGKMKELFSKPNQITYMRIILIPVFVIFLLMEIPFKAKLIWLFTFFFKYLSYSNCFFNFI